MEPMETPDLVRDEQPQQQPETENQAQSRFERLEVERNAAVDRANDLQGKLDQANATIERLEQEKQKLAMQGESMPVV